MSFLLGSEFVPAGILELHGEDAVGIVVGVGGEWADGLDEVTDIAGFELAGGSYTRLDGTFTVSRVADQWLLFVEDFTAIDLSDSASRVGVWLATDTGTLVGFQADAGAPTGSYLPTWPGGVVALPIDPVDLAGGAVATVTGDGVDNTDPQNPVIEGIPDPAGSTAGQTWTSTGPSTDAEWTTPDPGGLADWEPLDDGANLATFALGDDFRLVKAWWTGGARPVVAAGPAPVLIGVVQAGHRPAAAVQGRAGWGTNPPAAGDLLWTLDHDGSSLGTAGGLWVMDASGTLSDSDDVTPDLSTVEWWLTP